VTVDRIWAVTRTDLPWAHRTVQVGHALAQLGADLGGRLSPDAHLIVLAVKDEDELKAIAGQAVVEFYEPDRNGEMTAVAGFGRAPALHLL